MTREELRDASETLAAVSDHAGDAGDRLADLADQLETLATREKGPDHGRLARILNALSEVEEDAPATVADAIDEARERIVAYRETVEGV